MYLSRKYQSSKDENKETARISQAKKALKQIIQRKMSDSTAATTTTTIATSDCSCVNCQCGDKCQCVEQCKGQDDCCPCICTGCDGSSSCQCDKDKCFCTKGCCVTGKFSRCGKLLCVP